MRFPLLSLGLIAALVAHAPALAADPVAGRWVTEEGDSIVTIGPCGAQTCGRVTTFLRRPDTPNPVDRNNPDPKLRGRPVLGMPVLTGFTDAGAEWRGRIYDPRSGRSYKSTLRRNPDGTLKVQGCWGPFCRSQTWRPAR